MNNINYKNNNHEGAWGFCFHCGEKIAFSAVNCPKCGTQNLKSSSQSEQKSKKSYGIAVALCGIFGMMGVHHFYIGKYLHGLFDLSLFLGWLYIFLFVDQIANPNIFIFGIGIFILDIIHTIFIFYRLIISEQRDGEDKLILP